MERKTLTKVIQLTGCEKKKKRKRRQTNCAHDNKWKRKVKTFCHLFSRF